MDERAKDPPPGSGLNEQSYHLAIVGTDGKEKKFKVINKDNKIVNHQKFSYGKGELTQTCFVKNHKAKINSFISGTDQGCVQIMSYPYKDGGITSNISHKGSITRL